MNTAVTITRETKETATGYSRISAFLRDQLLGGQLRTGDFLLPERELAARLDVSRPVVREALRALSMIGVLEIRHGVGTVVKRPDVSTLGEFFTFALAQQSDVIDDIMQARIAIEHQAIRLVCQRASQHDFDRLADALTTIVETINDPDAGAAADFAFHEAIVQAAKSPTLATIYASIAELMMRSHRERREQIVRIEGFERFLVDHHRSIFAAIVDRDTSKADELLARHFEIGADFRRRATARHIMAASQTAREAVTYQQGISE